MARPQRAEVWLVDLGIAAKTRPALVLTNAAADDELDLFTIVLHTTALRGNQWELHVPKPFLKTGAFHFQQLQSVPRSRFIRALGRLNPREMSEVETLLARRFGLAERE